MAVAAIGATGMDFVEALRALAPLHHTRRCAQVLTGAILGDLDGKHAILVQPDGETIIELDIDTLVAVTAPRPALDLIPVLERLGIDHRIVGDALAPRTAMHAFKEGHEAALNV